MQKFTFFSSSVGWILISEFNGFIVSLEFLRENHTTSSGKFQEDIKTSETALLEEAKKQLEEYFLGKRRTFTLPLQPEGTSFQQKCWKVLQEIPYGTTISYGEEAKKVGGKNYARAVGMANGKNPIPIIIPCHRVIGANGKLTGFASGIDIKQQLLKLEGITLNE